MKKMKVLLVAISLPIFLGAMFLLGQHFKKLSTQNTSGPDIATPTPFNKIIPSETPEPSITETEDISATLSATPTVKITATASATPTTKLTKTPSATPSPTVEEIP
ncbi:MAG: hypothetical protein ABI425_03770 [Patescibacteria group bacterium]